MQQLPPLQPDGNSPVILVLWLLGTAAASPLLLKLGRWILDRYDRRDTDEREARKAIESRVETLTEQNAKVLASNAALSEQVKYLTDRVEHLTAQEAENIRLRAYLARHGVDPETGERFPGHRCRRRPATPRPRRPVMDPHDPLDPEAFADRVVGGVIGAVKIA